MSEDEISKPSLGRCIYCAYQTRIRVLLESVYEVVLAHELKKLGLLVWSGRGPCQSRTTASVLTKPIAPIW